MAGGGGGSTTPSETRLDKTLASIGVAKQLDYVQNVLPSQIAGINMITQQQPAMQQQALGISSANYAQNVAATQPQLTSQLANQGGGGGGQMKLGLGDFMTKMGGASGTGQAASQLGSQTSFANNLGSLVATGQGQAGTAMQGLNAAAQSSQQQSIIDARAATAAQSSLSNTLGTGLGLTAGSFMNPYSSPQAYGAYNQAQQYSQPGLNMTSGFGTGGIT